MEAEGIDGVIVTDENEIKNVGYMKKTYKELMEVINVVDGLYAKTPTLKDSKFGYAFKKFFDKNCASLVKEFNEKLQDANLEFALVDEKTKEVLYTDEKRTYYKMDKASSQKLIDFNRKLTREYEPKEIEITPFISKYKPELSEYQEEVLRGLLV